MQTSEKELMREANVTGFRPEIMEKVWHLMAILDGISIHPFLKDRLVLKGGTALNLFFFDLPRLSVDIDLNYIGQLDRQEMLLERPEVEKALEAIFQREGLIIVPERGDEDEQEVIGIHEGIISSELFDKVQIILARIFEKNASRAEKINYRDELPLRGLLQCPKCHSSWTCSGSKGNGGTYFYYHCQNGCKERIKAEEANLVFSDYLKSFQVHPEVSNLYMAIMEDIFKTKEGDGEEEIDRFQKALAELEPQLLKIDQMYVAGDLEKDSYQRMKASYKDEVQQLQTQISRLTSTDTNFMKYCRYGMSLLGNLDFHYQQSLHMLEKNFLVRYSLENCFLRMETIELLD